MQYDRRSHKISLHHAYISSTTVLIEYLISYSFDNTKLKCIVYVHVGAQTLSMHTL